MVSSCLGPVNVDAVKPSIREHLGGGSGIYRGALAQKQSTECHEVRSDAARAGHRDACKWPLNQDELNLLLLNDKWVVERAHASNSMQSASPSAMSDRYMAASR